MLNKDQQPASALQAAAAAASAAAAAAADLNRPIDPTIHHGFLVDLHQATVASDDHGREFMQILQKEVEPAIKELSTCLLYSDRSRGELDECISKFETALEHMRSAQQSMEASLSSVREHSEHYPT